MPHLVEGMLAIGDRPNVGSHSEDCTAIATSVAVVEQGKRHEVGQSLDLPESAHMVSREASPNPAAETMD